MTDVIHPAPTPARAVRELDIDGDVTLFHEPTKTALVLNGTASDVWRLLDGRRGVDDIVRLLCRSYAADPATVRDGVESALRQLAAHHVVDGVADGVVTGGVDGVADGGGGRAGPA